MTSRVQVVRLTADHVIKNFDCGDPELNEFLKKDSFEYLRRLLAVTYLIETDEDTIAFFSLSNDKISQANASSNSVWKKIKRQFHRDKHRADYPAVKIGRLAVSEKFHRQGYGSQIINLIKQTFITNNRTGCCYITIDAYQTKEAIACYEKNGFKRLNPTEKDKPDSTVLMYYNLHELI